jgi:tRNA nucleotidyltransferase/poly(A) polymerase
MTNIRAFEVGGCVRDDLLGLRSKDIDFAVEAPSFEAMTMWLLNEGFEIFLSTEEFLTIRARFPRDDRAPLGREGMTADFVLCRKDGPSSDGRRPDFVEPGTIEDDLARRDFTVNAMARRVFEGGHWMGTFRDDLVDPHGGREDLKEMRLRFVGNPFSRLAEDGLRALRAIRFAVTKGFMLDHTVTASIRSLSDPNNGAGIDLLGGVSMERIREELHKAFKHDTIATLALLDEFPIIKNHVFRSGGLWLEPTMKQ